MQGMSSLKRTLGWSFVVALSIAAVVAAVALVSGDFGDGEWKTIVTSLAFAVFSATAAAGAGLRVRFYDWRETVGTLTAIVSLAAFASLCAALWIDEDSETLWRVWGCCAISSLAGAHASLVLGALRHDDGEAVRMLAWASLLTAAIDWAAGFLAIADVIHEPDEDAAKVLAVLVIALLLTTALQPIVRRLQRESRPRGAAGEPPAAGALATAVLDVADRIDELNRVPGGVNQPGIARECERLRELARSRPRG
jgi:hypothetical protein